MVMTAIGTRRASSALRRASPFIGGSRDRSDQHVEYGAVRHPEQNFASTSGRIADRILVWRYVASRLIRDKAFCAARKCWSTIPRGAVCAARRRNAGIAFLDRRPPVGAQRPQHQSNCQKPTIPTIVLQ